jgi:RNA polymerase sigma factor (sigma-70 family)
VADGFARALGSLEQLRDPASVEGWIMRCIARAAIDLSRRSARLRPYGTAFDLDRARPAASAASPCAAEAALITFEWLAVRRAMAEIPDRHRELLCLRFQAGLSVREIAERLGAPEGTLRRRCMEASRTLEQTFLRAQLRPAFGACAPITQLLCRGARRELSPASTRKVAAHLRHCPGCRARHDELTALVAGLRRRRTTANRG